MFFGSFRTHNTLLSKFQFQTLRKFSGKMSSILTGEQRKSALQEIPTWIESKTRDAIEREYKFKDFKEAWKWMQAVADYADSPNVDHHPEWFNVYNQVKVTLATHTCNGVSNKDIDLAKVMDKLYEKNKPQEK